MPAGKVFRSTKFSIYMIHIHTERNYALTNPVTLHPWIGDAVLRSFSCFIRLRDPVGKYDIKKIKK